MAQTSNLITLLSPFTEVVGADTKAPKGQLAGFAVTKDDAVQAMLVYQGWVLILGNVELEIWSY